jgi:hypothetical protein
MATDSKLTNSNVPLAPSALGQATATAANPGEAIRVVLLYKRNVPADDHVLHLLETELGAREYKVWIDRNLSLGVEWANEIERQIRTAHAVIPLLSETSIRSEMMGFEIENAHEAAQQQQGRPRLFPIRIAYEGPLPDPLAGILDPIQYIVWQNPADDQRVPKRPFGSFQPKGFASPRGLSPPRRRRLLPPCPCLWNPSAALCR